MQPPADLGERSAALGLPSWRHFSCPTCLQPSSMQAATSSVMGQKDLHSLSSLKGRRRRGSLAAAVAQCLSLGMMCTAGAFPSWVVVQGTTMQFVLGAACALNPRHLSSHSLILDYAGFILLKLIALCCLLAILSSCGALLLDFLGLPLGRVAAPLLHGLAALFAAIGVATSSCLLALTRRNLRTKQELQPLGLSSVFGSSFFFCIIAFALAAIATGWSCTALAQVEPAVALCHTRVKKQQTSSCPTPEGDTDSNTHCFPSSLQQETRLPMDVSIPFIQGETELKIGEGPPFKQEEIELRMEESVNFLHKETNLQREESLSSKRVEIQAQMSQYPYHM